jgi:hypothetical protein
MEERFVTNPRLNKEIDERAMRLMALRKIYYMTEYNLFICLKKVTDEGKVYSEPCNFMADSTTNIGNYIISDKYISEKCVHIQDIETLDKYAYQHNLSVKQFNIAYGSYRVAQEDAVPLEKELMDRYVTLTTIRNNPEIKQLKDDPVDRDDFEDMDFPDLDEPDNYLWDD